MPAYPSNTNLRVCECSPSRVLFAFPWTIAHQAHLFMGFLRQEYWSGFPFPPPGDLLNLGIELVSPESPALEVDIYHFATWEAHPSDSINNKPKNPLGHTQVVWERASSTPGLNISQLLPGVW